jgi:hypothetical protein
VRLKFAILVPLGVTVADGVALPVGGTTHHLEPSHIAQPQSGAGPSLPSAPLRPTHGPICPC